jgi:hypothetical protein
MARKKQEGKADIVFEFVRKLPVIKIAMSDNRGSRPKEVKIPFSAPQFTPEPRDLVRALHWWSKLRFKRN